MLRGLQKTVLDFAKDRFSIRGIIDGQADNGWIVIDFGNIIVHLFGPEQRAFYQLEKLWDRGKTLVVVQ